MYKKNKNKKIYIIIIMIINILWAYFAYINIYKYIKNIYFVQNTPISINVI